MTKPIQVPEAVAEALFENIGSVKRWGEVHPYRQEDWRQALAAALEKYNELLLGDEAVEAMKQAPYSRGATRVELGIEGKLERVQLKAALDSVLGGGDSG